MPFRFKSSLLEHNCIHIYTHHKQSFQKVYTNCTSWQWVCQAQREQDFLPRLTVLRKFAGLWCAQFKRFSLKMLRCKARASTVSAILCTMAIVIFVGQLHPLFATLLSQRAWFLESRSQPLSQLFICSKCIMKL